MGKGQQVNPFGIGGAFDETCLGYVTFLSIRAEGAESKVCGFSHFDGTFIYGRL